MNSLYNYSCKILLFLCSCVFLNEGMTAQNTVDDPLLHIKEKGERLRILDSLISFNESNPERLKWINQFIKEAKEADNREKEEKGLRQLARYYYNLSHFEVVKTIASTSDSLAKEIGSFSNNYYDIQTFYAQFLIWKGEYEKALDHTLKLYNQSKSDSNANGIICSCETLGLINQRINQDSLAINFFEEGLGELKREKVLDYRFAIQFLTNLIESELKISNADSAETHIKELKVILKDIKDGKYKDGYLFPIDRCRLMVELYNINLYLITDQLKKIPENIKQAREIMPLVDEEYANLYLNITFTKYYMRIKEYNRALLYLEKALESDPTPELIQMKGEILLELNRPEEAAKCFLNALALSNVVHDETFTRQLNQLHTMHDMNNLQLKVKELQFKELAFEANKTKLRFTTMIIVILIVIIILSLIIYIHTNKLKNELQRDKQALLDSEKALRLARDKAQESERLKTLFLSNMSHEIRTPLNAIVGFTQLLEIEMKDNEDQREYAHIIIENSELLLNLVNDILDISRLESEKYQFTFEKQNLAYCCTNVIKSVEHRLKKGVKLIFNPQDKGFILNTDKLRLQQILINLIGNSAKFTSEGFIELAYTIDKEEGFVRFSVTDTGCGIPENKQEAIFERFEKLNECVQGTGLGLSICRIIAEQFKGKVFLDKDYKGGARFIFLHAINIE